MTMTLQLPAELSDELEQQAERIGISPEEHATVILSVAAAMVGDPAYFAVFSGYRGQLARTMLEMIRVLLDEQRSEADRARLLRLAALLGDWIGEQPRQPRSRPSAMGKYAHISGTSDDFARLKQEEIDREDRSAH